MTAQDCPDGWCTLRLTRPPVVVNAGLGLHGRNRSIDRFSLPDLWSLHLYAYTATLVIGGRDHTIVPGSVSLVPPGVPTEYRYGGPSQHLYAHVRLASEGPAHQVPMLSSAGDELPLLRMLLREALAAGDRTPERASAAVWAVLWHLVQAGDRDAGDPHVRSATRYLELHLAEPVTVPQVAAAAGISHNQLTRLFRAELGCTVVGYLRRRRLERARHLLRESTMPIAGVAATVGIPDLQAFNKACRREFDRSPRALRQERHDS